MTSTRDSFLYQGLPFLFDPNYHLTGHTTCASPTPPSKEIQRDLDVTSRESAHHQISPCKSYLSDRKPSCPSTQNTDHSNTNVYHDRVESPQHSVEHIFSKLKK